VKNQVSISTECWAGSFCALSPL